MSPTMNAAVTFPRLLMTASAVFLLLLGVPCMFAPDIVLAHLVGSTSMAAEMLVQLAGALYVGFAALNWMSRGSLMGGIYGRPVSIGNLLHFVAGAFTLVKAAPAMPEPVAAWVVAILYALCAAGFARVVFHNPLPTSSGTTS
jgi:hypothetical protein